MCVPQRGQEINKLSWTVWFFEIQLKLMWAQLIKPVTNAKTFFSLLFLPIIETQCAFLKIVNLSGWSWMDTLVVLQRGSSICSIHKHNYRLPDVNEWWSHTQGWAWVKSMCTQQFVWKLTSFVEPNSSSLNIMKTYIVWRIHTLDYRCNIFLDQSM